jgi:hypothetical protein
MISGAASRDASVMVADIGRMGGNMGDPSGFPKGNFAPPIVLIALARRYPHFETHVARLVSGIAR